MVQAVVTPRRVRQDWLSTGSHKFDATWSKICVFKPWHFYQLSGLWAMEASELIVCTSVLPSVGLSWCVPGGCAVGHRPWPHLWRTKTIRRQWRHTSRGVPEATLTGSPDNRENGITAACCCGYNGDDDTSNFLNTSSSATRRNI